MNSTNNKQVREIVEDVPQYRSVMISGPISAPPIPRSFASVRPAKAPLQTIQQDKQTVSSATWKVSDLPSLPAAYFLEKSNVYVDGDAQDVANRICDCLRKESVAAFCDKDDKVRFTSFATHCSPVTSMVTDVECAFRDRICFSPRLAIVLS